MRIQQRSRAASGFTLIEMLITLALLGILTGIVVVMALHSRAQARAIKCLSNQRRVSEAILAFYSQNGDLPLDGDGSNLSAQLSEFIPWPENQRMIGVPAVYRCPNDTSDAMSNSYEEFYVRRQQPHDANYYLLGCPRHCDASGKAINSYGLGHTADARIEPVLANGAAVDMDGPGEARAITEGALRFADGSRATIVKAESGFQLTVVTSCRDGEGRLYTIVRMHGTGAADFKVTPGSRFEVVAPVALVGVRGTRFTVETDTAFARIACAEGCVAVESRLSGGEREVLAGQEIEIGAPDSGNDLHIEHINKDEWLITNPNDFRVDYFWQVVDGVNTGYHYVDENNSKMLHTGDKNGAIIRLTYELPDMGTRIIMGAWKREE